jgi:hypothetical protein
MGYSHKKCLNVTHNGAGQRHQVIYRYLDAARPVIETGAIVRTASPADYGHEYLLAFAWKRHHFYPSMKRKFLSNGIVWGMRTIDAKKMHER